MTQFTSSLAKCSHVCSSGRTKNCSAGFRQWALQDAIPVLHHVSEWGQCWSQASLQQLCSTSRTIPGTSCCSHGHPRVTCTQRAPGSPLQTRLPEMYLGTKSSKSLWCTPKISWGEASERIQSPAQYWVSHPGKPGSQKKINKRR